VREGFLVKGDLAVYDRNAPLDEGEVVNFVHAGVVRTGRAAPVLTEPDLVDRPVIEKEQE